MTMTPDLQILHPKLPTSTHPKFNLPLLPHNMYASNLKAYMSRTYIKSLITSIPKQKIIPISEGEREEYSSFKAKSSL